jgi:hypothetical protein
VQDAQFLKFNKMAGDGMKQSTKQAGKAMARGLKPRVMVQACSIAVAACALGWMPEAAAARFTLGEDYEGQWSLGASVGRAWRTTDADPDIIGKAYGGTSSGLSHMGNLNYGKGDAYSTPLTVTGEVQIERDNLGLVLGGRA